MSKNQKNKFNQELIRMSRLPTKELRLHEAIRIAEKFDVPRETFIAAMEYIAKHPLHTSDNK